MHYICCSCHRGPMIWSLQRGRSHLREVVNRILLYVLCVLVSVVDLLYTYNSCEYLTFLAAPSK